MYLLQGPGICDPKNPPIRKPSGARRESEAPSGAVSLAAEAGRPAHEVQGLGFRV